MENQTATATKPTTARKGVVLIDGHRYRDAAGRFHKLTASTKPTPTVQILLALTRCGEDWGTGVHRLQQFDSDNGFFWYGDIRKGLPGIFNEGEVDLADSYTLVEDITAADTTEAQPEAQPEASPVAVAPGTFKLEAGKSYVTRGGEVVGPIVMATDLRNGPEYIFGVEPQEENYYYRPDGRIFDDIKDEEDLVKEVSAPVAVAPAKDTVVNLGSLKAGQKFKGPYQGSSTFTRTELPLSERGSVLSPDGGRWTGEEDDQVIIVN